MGSANLTEEQIMQRYPSSILEWEMKHGIGRYERNGMLYVCAMRPFAQVCESINREREAIEAKEHRREILNDGQQD